MEDRQLGQFQPQDLGRLLHGPPPETSLRWKFPASSAATTRPFTAWSSRSWSARARLISLQRHGRDPAGNTIKLRVETIDYFLKRYREDLLDRKKKQADIERQLAEYERGLRERGTGMS